MATATPGPTPNPDAMRFQLDVTLPETMNFTSADAAAADVLHSVGADDVDVRDKVIELLSDAR